MGHYFYGKMEYEIQTYLPYLERRVEGARKAGGIFYPRSWVDYYLIGDLYIAGFGQDFSESDIWYLACTKSGISLRQRRIIIRLSLRPAEKTCVTKKKPCWKPTESRSGSGLLPMTVLTDMSAIMKM